MLDSPVRERVELRGSNTPRVGPPVPARSLFHEWEDVAHSIGMDPFPWQSYLARITDAVRPDPTDEWLWLYAEIAALVSRQNGKTEFVLPFIVRRMEMGRRVLHAAQTRELPRATFFRLAPIIETRHPDARIRRSGGQEEIELPNGGFYKIIAATGGAPRGLTIDDLIIDELREIKEEFVAAARPTLAARPNPQILELSNAGDEDSVALRSVQMRAGQDDALAYLEWSAAPERDAGDPEGWVEANPSIGYIPGLRASVERAYVAAKAGGTMAHFETEHLCRYVATLRQTLVDEFSWVRCHVEDAGPVRRPAVAVSMDPQGTRASVAVAWIRSEGNIGLRLLFNVTGNPIDTDRLGQDVKTVAARMGAKLIGYDPQSDAELVKYFKKAEPINGLKFANASAQFVNILTAGRLAWDDAAAVGDDLTWTSRLGTGDQGSYHAVRAKDDRPITAALAAIRAVWLASGPQPGVPNIY